MSILGKTVTVTVDRAMGTRHPNHSDIIYPINYGYIKGIIVSDGEEQDAYIIGVTEPVENFTGRVIAVIHRLDDIEDKWVVAPFDKHFSRQEIINQVNFQEKYFKISLRVEE
ncbi:MAG: inorganic diphosphatase [Acutalibacteraceae bacterium]